MNRSTPGLPVHNQLLEFTQTHVHWVSDAIQPSHPLSSASPPAPNPSQHESFPMSQLFAWGVQSTGVPALVSVLPKNTQDWSPLEYTGWISLQPKGLSRVFSNTTVQKHQLIGAQLSSQSSSYIHTLDIFKIFLIFSNFLFHVHRWFFHSLSLFNIIRFVFNLRSLTFFNSIKFIHYFFNYFFLFIFTLLSLSFIIQTLAFLFMLSMFLYFLLYMLFVGEWLYCDTLTTLHVST